MNEAPDNHGTGWNTQDVTSTTAPRMDGESTDRTSGPLPLAPLTCSAPIAVEIRKAIDSINRHIDYIDVQRGGYSDDVKQKAYKDRSKLVDALIAMVPNTEVCQSGEPATDDNLPME